MGIASCLVAVSAASTFHSRNIWYNFFVQKRESENLGFYSEQMFKLRDTERGLEGCFSLLLQVLSMPFSVQNRFDYFTYCTSMALSLHGVFKLRYERALLEASSSS